MTMGQQNEKPCECCGYEYELTRSGWCLTQDTVSYITREADYDEALAQERALNGKAIIEDGALFCVDCYQSEALEVAS